MNLFYIIFILIVTFTMIELLIAAINERWLIKIGGQVSGEDYYVSFILLTVLFLISLFIEVIFIKDKMISFNLIFFIIYLMTLLGKAWCIHSLGRFWNIKAIIIPKVFLLKTGPYRFVKNPDYFISFIELIVISLIFKAYFTGILFPLMYVSLLIIRKPQTESLLNRNV